MSNVIYPISIIAKLQQSEMDRTVKDSFEDGGTYARNTWGLQTFKRQFQIQHSALTLAEWNALRTFYRARSGQFDPFWFRNNIDRTGNANVRFAKSLQPQFAGNTRSLNVDLEEVAAIRCLPDMSEVTAAAGIAPLVWYDASREKYFTNLGTVTMPESAYAYDAFESFPATWQVGSLTIGNIFGQWQHHPFDGTRWARSATLAAITGSQPAVTIFFIAKNSATTTRQVLFSLGAAGTGTAYGVELTAAGSYFPFNGQATIVGGAGAFPNSAADTWRSFALCSAAASNQQDLYVNAAIFLSLTSTRAFTSGPAVLGAAPGGSLIANAGAAMTNCNLAHALVFAAQLTAAQIKAVHNLLGYQFGLATV